MGKHNKIDWEKTKLRELVAEGKKHYEIAKEIGCSPGTISTVCKKMGLKCHRRGPRGAEGHPDWNGGRFVDKDGYVLRYANNHPNARAGRNKYVLEHRLVMEEHIGRFLDRKEVVHHKDGNKQNNAIENLELYSKNSEHLKAELTGKCPNWSEEGKRRLLDAVHRRWNNERQKRQQQSLPGA